MQLGPLSAGFAAFCFTLAGYFLLLPLRDEAGVSLGTHNLPRLFVGCACCRISTACAHLCAIASSDLDIASSACPADRATSRMPYPRRSLFLTFLATPLASAFLSRSPAKERGLQLLFRCLSMSILGGSLGSMLKGS